MDTIPGMPLGEISNARLIRQEGRRNAHCRSARLMQSHADVRVMTRQDARKRP